MDQERTRYELLGISPRSWEVAKYLAAGENVKDVSRRFNRSVKTIDVHKYSVMSATGMHTIEDLKFAVTLLAEADEIEVAQEEVRKTLEQLPSLPLQVSLDEWHLALMLAKNMSDEDIAAECKFSIGLAREYRLNLVNKIGVSNAGQVYHVLHRLVRDEEAELIKNLGITAREWEVGKFFVAGLKKREVAPRLGLSSATVGTHKVNLMAKFDLRNGIDLVLFYIHQIGLEAVNAIKKKLNPEEPLSELDASFSEDITEREWEVAKLRAGGIKIDDIAEKLGIALPTAVAHNCNFMRKARVHNGAGLMLYVANEIGIEALNKMRAELKTSVEVFADYPAEVPSAAVS